MNQSREPAVAGQFYPDEPDTLRRQVAGYLNGSPQKAVQKPRFLVVPHAGYSYSGAVAGSAYAQIKGYDYQQVVLLGPSHHYSFLGCAATMDNRWACPVGKFAVSRPSGWGLTQARYHQPEHSLEVQLPFLHQLLPEATLFPFLCSGPLQSAASLAEQMQPLYGDENCLWVISSDMNHVGPRFGYDPQKQGYDSGAAMDQAGLELVCAGDIKGFTSWLTGTNATICGALPILMTMLLNQGSTDKRSINLQSYDHSASTHPSDSSVGYAALFG